MIKGLWHRKWNYLSYHIARKMSARKMEWIDFLLLFLMISKHTKHLFINKSNMVQKGGEKSPDQLRSLHHQVQHADKIPGFSSILHIQHRESKNISEITGAMDSNHSQMKELQ